MSLGTRSYWFGYITHLRRFLGWGELGDKVVKNTGESGMHAKDYKATYINSFRDAHR